ncbi:MAG: AI-2E family transporter [bacterium]
MAKKATDVFEALDDKSSNQFPWWRTIAFVALLGALAVFGYMDFDQYLRPTVTILVFAAILNYLLKPIVDGTLKLIRQEKSHNWRVTVVLVLYCAIAIVLYVFGAMAVRTIRGNMSELSPSVVGFYNVIKVGAIAPVTKVDVVAQDLNADATAQGIKEDAATPDTDVTAITLDTDATPDVSTHAAKKVYYPPQIKRFDYWYQTNIPLEVRAQIWASVQQQMGASPEKMQGLVAWLLGLAQRGFVWVGMLIEFIFVPLLAFYFLTEAPKVRDSIIYFIPRSKRDIVSLYMDGINLIMSKYVQSQVILGAIAWAVVTLALVCLGIRGAFILGIIAGVSRIIPMIGPLVGGIPVMAGVLLHEQGSSYFLWVLLGFTLLQLFETKYLMPRILGDHLEIHPVLIIISLLIGYELLGLIGMFLAPPAVAVIRFALAVHRGEHSGPDIPKSLEGEVAEVNITASN